MTELSQQFEKAFENTLSIELPIGLKIAIVYICILFAITFRGLKYNFELIFNK